ncbi:aspartate/glutamate racemase family protein [Listeria newyorkensis]|uniref:Aspartate/glutamate racemase family protein n=1 Tax=Listeria newyorkensis TaxID=1497681 RepID=A0A841YXB3_9LIST|nr:aspartate/glutamate racemase family protein [Listeria newyorkensis]MBC1457303.1 aspartate/glutamate racemase family protein [Listeria newyorkensis]
MKKIGLIGGMSWESTTEYYRIINEAVRETLGELHSAEIILYSVDFYTIEELQHEGKWEEAGRVLADIAVKLERAGADLIVICTNTMHKVARQVEDAIGIPLLHIAEPTIQAIGARKLERVLLLGTRYTMVEDFYKGRYAGSGIEVWIPNEADRDAVNRIIFEELCLGVIREDSRAKMLAMIEKAGEKGAQGVVLGCTELELLIREQDVALPIFKTAELHAEYAAKEALR